jgi:Domain of unknown function (DUF4203)
MLLGGGASGFIALKVLAIGMFALGASLGVVAAESLKPVLWNRYFASEQQTAFIVGACVLGLVCGLLALAMQKKMLILSTAYAGAFALFFSVGHFAGHFPSLADVDKVERGDFDEPWTVLYLAATAFFGTAGLLCQLTLTRDKVMPIRAPYSRHRHHRRLRSEGPCPIDARAVYDDDEHWKLELLAATARIEMLAASRHASRQGSIIADDRSGLGFGSRLGLALGFGVNIDKVQEHTDILSKDSENGVGAIESVTLGKRLKILTHSQSSAPLTPDSSNRRSPQSAAISGGFLIPEIDDAAHLSSRSSGISESNAPDEERGESSWNASPFEIIHPRSLGTGNS